MPKTGMGGSVEIHFINRSQVRRSAIYWLGMILSVLLVACPDLPDTTPPSVNILNPSNNATVSNANLTVNGSASDNVSITNLEITINGGTRQKLPLAAVFQFTAKLSIGSNEIKVYAKDAAGNEGNAKVSITYALPRYSLSVAKAGNGSILSNPTGINCGTDCTEDYEQG